jgi:hypothetical protein
LKKLIVHEDDSAFLFDPEMTPFSILSARLQSDTPVCGVAIEPYVLVRRADGTTVTAGMLNWLFMLLLDA